MKNKELVKKIKASVVAGSKLYQRYLELDEKSSSLRAKIAKLATEICEIHHGGRYSGTYTLQKFAIDIGMSHKTLSTWVQIFKMGLKIEISEPTDEEWTRLRRALIIEKQECSTFAQRIGAASGENHLKKDVIKELVTQKRRNENTHSPQPRAENTSAILRVSLGRFIRVLDSQQENLSNYRKGDLQVEELELLKNYVSRMKKRVDQFAGDKE